MHRLRCSGIFTSNFTLSCIRPVSNFFSVEMSAYLVFAYWIYLYFIYFKKFSYTYLFVDKSEKNKNKIPYLRRNTVQSRLTVIPRFAASSFNPIPAPINTLQHSLCLPRCRVSRNWNCFQVHIFRLMHKFCLSLFI